METTEYIAIDAARRIHLSVQTTGPTATLLVSATLQTHLGEWEKTHIHGFGYTRQTALRSLNAQLRQAADTVASTLDAAGEADANASTDAKASA